MDDPKLLNEWNRLINEIRSIDINDMVKILSILDKNLERLREIAMIIEFRRKTFYGEQKGVSELSSSTDECD